MSSENDSKRLGESHLLPVLISVAVILAASVGLSQVPLFNVLGYEFSLVMGAIIPLVLGLFWMGRGKLRVKSFGTVVLLLIPPLVMLANMAFVKNCSYAEGLAFYALGPVLGSFFAVSLALAIESSVKRWAKVLFVLAYLAVLILPVLYRLYATPQIFFFNYIFGYFSGPIYDVAVEVDSRYIYFRLETLLLSSILLLWALRKWYVLDISASKEAKLIYIWRFIPRWMRALAVLIPLFLFLWAKNDDLGITSSYEQIKHELAPLDSAKHWYASPNISVEEKQVFKRRIELELADLKKVIGLETLPEIDIFIYPDAETKGIFTGSERTEFTKIWRNEIHITAEGFDRAIRHELVHILFGRYGIQHLGLSKSIGFLEGIAAALETPDPDWTDDEYAAAIDKLKLTPEKPEEMLGAVGFWTGLGAKSYTLMGSFTGQLLEKQGIEKFKSVYAGANLESVYGKDAGGLMADWQADVKKISVSPELESAARFRFDRKSIFQAECPHLVAKRLRYAEKALREKDYQTSADIYREVLTLTGGKEPEALQGYIQARLFAADQKPDQYAVVFAEADTLVRRLEKPEPAIFTIANARLWTGYGSKDSAVRELESLYKKHISFAYDVAVQLRLAMIREGVQTKMLSPLVSNEERLKLIQSELDTTASQAKKQLLGFVMGRQLILQYRYAEALNYFDAAGAFEQPELELERQMGQLKACLVLGKFDEAKEVAVQAKEVSKKNVGTTAKRSYIDAQLQLYGLRLEK
ncbi:MAG: hypothetical protein HGB11_06030 [Chlorobiales bacterium]|nr:hypothetical protein [Chlorobiales bacterium]